MSAIEINRQLFIKALNRLRVQLFGDDEMQIFEITPETGESLLETFTENFTGREITSATDSASESSYWQFQIVATDDWETSQAFMLKIVSFKIGNRRWKAKKVKKPVGNSKVWQLKAEIQ